MLRLLPAFAMIAFALFALIDCLARDDDEIRGLPKFMWVFVILLFPVVGPAGWFLAGRPRAADGWLARGDLRNDAPVRPAAPRRMLAPDDDPEFLRSLSRRRREDEPGP
jgi:hypothetical protein